MRAVGQATVVLANLAFLICILTACGSLVLHDAPSTGDTVTLTLRSPDAPVLIAKMDDVDVPLWFDLGDSTPLTLQKSILDAIKAVPTGQSIKLQGIDGDFEVPLYKVPRLQIGKTVFTNVTAKLDAPRAGYAVSQSVRGYFGSGLLKANAVVLDYAHRRMVLLSGKNAAGQELCRGTAVNFSKSSPIWQGEAVTEADTDFGHVTLWWDTGAQATMMNQAASHATDRIVSSRFLLGDHDFGPWSFGLLIASLPGFDGMIGDDFFMKHRVCIDYPNSRVVIGD